MNIEMVGESWYEQLKEEFAAPYVAELKEKLREEYNTHKIHPAPGNIFKAFQLTPFEQVKVVIISQDPYPHSHAMGLAFSSMEREPPFSLQMILRELDRSLWKTENKEQYKEKVSSNDLSCWARQGVFLLNSHLTVRSGQANSHASIGWERLTTKVLELLMIDSHPKIFVLWGAEAKKIWLNTLHNIHEIGEGNLHQVLEAGHPAAAAHGKDLFSGNNHFLKINKWLERVGYAPINWEVHGES